MEYYRSAIILVVIMNDLRKIGAKLNLVPRNTEVKISDSTYINCSTSLQADQVQWRHGSNYIYTGIAILEPYNTRFSVEISPSTGACNLVIRSVQPSDAGNYECVEDGGLGEQSTAQLIVLDADPVCRSNMYSDGVIGPNSCGIEPEDVEMSCSIKYHGNSLPVLEWKSRGDNQSLVDGQTTVTSINNEVTYTLTMKSSLDLKNSWFICQTTRTTDKHHSCSSDAITILYVFSSEVTVNITVNDEVSCFANTSQSCSYRWKWVNGDDSTTESENQNLKPKKGGMHRCESICSIRNESCTVESMRAEVYSDPLDKVYSDAASSGPHLMLVFVLLLSAALAVIVVIMTLYCRRKRIKKRRRDEIELQRREKEAQQRLLEMKKPRLDETEMQGREKDERPRILEVERRRLDEIERQRREEEGRKRREEEERKRREDEERLKLCEVERRRLDEIERQRREEEERKRREEEERKRREDEERQKLRGLIATIRTKAAEEMQKSIAGLTILENELFVVSEESSEVEVYDSTNFSFSRQWTLKELIDPWDIVSCSRSKCLYISDYKVSGLSKEIFRVDRNGKLIKKWSTKIDFGSLSVTYDSNVILVDFYENKLNEYSPDGQLIREIYLSADEGFCHPRHAIKLTNGHFVVSHGSGSDGNDDDLHRVCIVDTDGKLLKSFGGKRGSTNGQTYSPTYLSVDGSGSVMVADYHNRRVLLLDSDLEFEKEILTIEHGLRDPNRILLDESNSRLFVSEYKKNNHRILIFDFSKRGVLL